MIEFEVTQREQWKILLKEWLARVFLLIGGEWFARLWARPSLAIVVYHRVLEDSAQGVQPYIGVTQAAFRAQLTYYRERFEVVSLNEGMRLLQAGHLKHPLLAITFDDGYRDNLDLALPVLQELELTATVFVTTDCLDRGEPLWPDRVRFAIYGAPTGVAMNMSQRSAPVPADTAGRISLMKSVLAHVKTLPGDERERFLSSLPQPAARQPSPRLMLNWDEARALANGGVAIESHTLSHPILTRLHEADSRREIGISRRVIEDRIGISCRWFAYPNGTASDFSDIHVTQLREAGYIGALTTLRGVNRPGVDPFRLRRTGVYGTDTMPVVRAKLAIESLMVDAA
jgi:peptidoglycan/xylan/chitin deacetylase (PgdA/CDA1 family)